LGSDAHAVYHLGSGVIVSTKYYVFICEIIVQAKIPRGDGPNYDIYEISINK
jgi:hypothetical protein